MTGLTRYPAVAGRFYPLNPEALKSELQAFIPEKPARPALGCLVPHAGYIYSGYVAGSVFAAIEIPKQVIVMCPNHTGIGHPLAIMSRGDWQTPLGSVPIDRALAEALKQRDPLLNEDPSAHRAEHAIEVELPFIQSCRDDFSFVPIALGTGNFETLSHLGNAIAETLKTFSNPVLVIASSDMNHYENDAVTRAKDHMAIKKILSRDPRKLFDTVTKEDISMCGFGPAIAMLTAVNAMGASQAELVKYATSGDVSGDRDTVVGYAGIIVR